MELPRDLVAGRHDVYCELKALLKRHYSRGGSRIGPNEAIVRL
jgi:hypothetical protein